MLIQSTDQQCFILFITSSHLCIQHRPPVIILFISSFVRIYFLFHQKELTIVIVPQMLVPKHTTSVTLSIYNIIIYTVMHLYYVNNRDVCHAYISMDSGL